MSKDNNQRRPPDDPFEMLFQGFSELVENLSQLGDTAPEEWEKSFRNQANRTNFTYNSNNQNNRNNRNNPKFWNVNNNNSIFIF